MIDGNLVLYTAPTVEPVTVAEAIRQLRIAEVSGEPAPSQPTVALISPAAAGNVDNGVHRYCVTFVTAAGETNAGDVSGPVTVADKTVNGKVSLSSIPIGSGNVTSRKIYRTIAGGSAFLLLATIADNTTTTYTDNIADSALGAGVPSTNTTDDTYVTGLIKAARQVIENKTGRALCTQTWDYQLDRFPCESFFWIPRPPISAITHIKYYAADGTLTTWDAANYIADLDDARGRIALAYNVNWPTAQDRANAVSVRFVTGYGAAALVPEGLKSAVKMVLQELYLASNPNASSAGLTQPNRELLTDLINAHRVRRVA